MTPESARVLCGAVRMSRFQNTQAPGESSQLTSPEPPAWPSRRPERAAVEVHVLGGDRHVSPGAPWLSGRSAAKCLRVPPACPITLHRANLFVVQGKMSSGFGGKEACLCLADLGAHFIGCVVSVSWGKPFPQDRGTPVWTPWFTSPVGRAGWEPRSVAFFPTHLKKWPQVVTLYLCSPPVEQHPTGLLGAGRGAGPHLCHAGKSRCLHQSWPAGSDRPALAVWV